VTLTSAFGETCRCDLDCCELPDLTSHAYAEGPFAHIMHEPCGLACVQGCARRAHGGESDWSRERWGLFRFASETLLFQLRRVARKPIIVPSLPSNDATQQASETPVCQLAQWPLTALKRLTAQYAEPARKSPGKPKDQEPNGTPEGPGIESFGDRAKWIRSFGKRMGSERERDLHTRARPL
jgi:hypothetical protein